MGASLVTVSTPIPRSRPTKEEPDEWQVCIDARPARKGRSVLARGTRGSGDCTTSATQLTIAEWLRLGNGADR